MNPLTQARKHHKLSKAAITKHLEISRNTWSDYEAGKRKVPVWLAYSVAHMRTLTPQELH